MYYFKIRADICDACIFYLLSTKEFLTSCIWTLLPFNTDLQRVQNNGDDKCVYACFSPAVAVFNQNISNPDGKCYFIEVCVRSCDGCVRYFFHVLTMCPCWREILFSCSYLFWVEVNLEELWINFRLLLSGVTMSREVRRRDGWIPELVLELSWDLQHELCAFTLPIGLQAQWDQEHLLFWGKWLTPEHPRVTGTVWDMKGSGAAARKSSSSPSPSMAGLGWAGGQTGRGLFEWLTCWTEQV